ncbi:WhiB family transcriptional regulator [Isoptericola sp. b441]|uniref:Transcriptional regulator WhiB n=1 Tax=Actinotalea lenta TaxID=3064654 RepID=A0ABT9DCF2_9CELL|nr:MULTISPECIES: WhiB family transcriptional regulator [unclassified Isoptericola]MDO8108570.1 WhiB family transcriptional regulator [Isoptericola sp. b441]MDO8119980.1 WhiB family transcriptional regulator [Isoptericola sp. b490]
MWNVLDDDAPFPSDLDVPVAPVLPLFGSDDPDETALDWQERALCAQTDPEAFFPEKGGSTREAKKVCTGCEVRAECLEYALANDERFGIWGGLSERERRKLKRRVV